MHVLNSTRGGVLARPRRSSTVVHRSLQSSAIQVSPNKSPSLTSSQLYTAVHRPFWSSHYRDSGISVQVVHTAKLFEDRSPSRRPSSPASLLRTFCRRPRSTTRRPSSLLASFPRTTLPSCRLWRAQWHSSARRSKRRPHHRRSPHARPPSQLQSLRDLPRVVRLSLNPLLLPPCRTPSV